ncbi:MAG: alkaline phosphatase family protein, partial [Actinomycetota bacterium]
LAWVLTQEEVLAAGLYGDVDSDVVPRLGDVFVLAKKDVAFYDERDTSLKGRNMIGQHGGVSPTELAIPGIRLGAYSR